jgi:predicted RNase H-like nuclease (RuvC/YqgF family)
LIAENSYLIPTYAKNKVCEKNSFLIMAKEVDQLNRDNKELLSNIEKINNKMDKLDVKLTNFQEQIKQDLKESIEEAFGPSAALKAN